MNEQPRILVCAPVDWPHHTAKSIATRGDCGHDVWISESGQKAQAANPRLMAICLNCTPKEGLIEWKPVAGALEEIEKNT